MTLVILLSILFGISQKIADALNEHGTFLFKYANLFFGVLFGFFGMLLITHDKVFLEFYLGLVLYWLLAGKLDFFNHQLSATLILISGLVVFNDYYPNIINVIFVIVLSLSFRIFKKIALIKNSKGDIFFGKKYHHFIFAILVGIWFSNIYIAISIVFTMLGIIFTMKVLQFYNNYIS
jgi:hypothetical protein